MQYPRLLLTLALLTATLSGCAHSGTNSGFGAVPADIQVCFDKLVPAPPRGEMNKQRMVALIAELRQSEVAKSQCGRRLLAWVATQDRILTGH